MRPPSLREVRLPLQEAPRNILRSIVQDARFREERYPRFVVLGYPNGGGPVLSGGIVSIQLHRITYPALKFWARTQDAGRRTKEQRKNSANVLSQIFLLHASITKIL